MISEATLFLLFAISGSLSTTIPEEWLRSRFDFQYDIKKNTKIVGGHKASIMDYNYLAFLKIDGIYQCGGSIIAGTVILTAAHCLESARHVTVRVGSEDSLNGGVLMSSSTLLLHPNYNRNTDDYDVAVIILPRALELNGRTIAAVKLAEFNSDLKTGATCTVAGWGDMSENGQFSRFLLAVDVFAVSRSECSSAYEHIGSNKICAGYPEGGKDSCQGDSGGPLVIAHGRAKTQVGIVSYGEGCARKGFPGVYARIGDPTIRRWIQQVAGV